MMTEPVNWQIATEEAVNHLVKLIRVDTSNPPGNELPAILIIKEILEAAGFPEGAFTIVESEPKRANLVARIRGDGSERPLLLSGHVDVVPAEREHWKHDPFSGKVIDQAVWGRGAMDMKGFLVMYLQVFLELFRQKTLLKRDVILAAIADEEKGFTHGSKFLVGQHRDLIDAEYGFTEAGAVTNYVGKTRLYPIQVAEKASCRLRMRVHGKIGHGSIPIPDNPIFLVGRAIEKLRKAGHLPVHLAPTAIKMIDSARSQINFPASALIGLLHSPTLMNLLLNHMKGYSGNIMKAWATNTIFLRGLHAGDEDRRDASMAELTCSIGLIPGQTPEDVIREIHQIVGADIELEVTSEVKGTEFSPDTSLYKLMEKRTKQMDPGGVVVPMLFPAKTDACIYQDAGITVYGFTPGVLPPDIQALTLAHGQDERLPISFIESGLPVIWDVVNEFCAGG